MVLSTGPVLGEGKAGASKRAPLLILASGWLTGWYPLEELSSTCLTVQAHPHTSCLSQGPCWDACSAVASGRGPSDMARNKDAWDCTQDRITDGYLFYAAAVRADLGVPIFIAPTGLAFKHVHEHFPPHAFAAAAAPTPATAFPAAPAASKHTIALTGAYGARTAAGSALPTAPRASRGAVATLARPYALAWRKNPPGRVQDGPPSFAVGVPDGNRGKTPDYDATLDPAQLLAALQPAAADAGRRAGDGALPPGGGAAFSAGSIASGTVPAADLSASNNVDQQPADVPCAPTARPSSVYGSARSTAAAAAGRSSGRSLASAAHGAPAPAAISGVRCGGGVAVEAAELFSEVVATGAEGPMLNHTPSSSTAHPAAPALAEQFASAAHGTPEPVVASHEGKRVAAVGAVSHVAATAPDRVVDHAPGSATTFADLYFKDGNHPSAIGVYLESCVVASAITGAQTLHLVSLSRTCRFFVHHNQLGLVCVQPYRMSHTGTYACSRQ